MGLGQGDVVGVAESWEWPGDFDGVTRADLLRVQRAIQNEPLPRYSAQATTGVWAGAIVAEVLGLDADTDRARISRMIAEWLKSGALKKVQRDDPYRHPVPCLEVGEWATED